MSPVSILYGFEASTRTDIAYRPIKSNDAQKLIQAFPIWQQRLDTVYLIKSGRSYVRSAAAIRCLRVVLKYGFTFCGLFRCQYAIFFTNL